MIAATILVLTASMGGTPALPSPTGMHAVGHTSFVIEDTTRPEPFTEDATDHRTLHVELWYPAAPGTTPRKRPYLDGETAWAFADGDSAKAAFLATLQASSGVDAAVLSRPEPLPIVIFSHGHGTHPALHTTTLEDIASHGYVVAAINHTYSSMISRLGPERAVTFRTPWEEGAPWEEQGKHMEALVELWSFDARFVLDWLQSVNDEADSRFRGVLDLERVAGMGHSLSGPSIGMAAMRDQRFTGTIHLDSSIYGGKLDCADHAPVTGRSYDFLLRPQRKRTTERATLEPPTVARTK